MTFGEIMVGTHFNPSGNSDVAYVKNEFAKLINLAQTVVNDKLKESAQSLTEEDGEINEDLFLYTDVVEIVHTSAIQKLLDAQMTLVKLLTLTPSMPTTRIMHVDDSGSQSFINI